MPKQRKKLKKKPYSGIYNSNLFRLVVLIAVIVAVVGIALVSSHDNATNRSSDDGRAAADDFARALTNCDFQKVQNYYSDYHPNTSLDKFKQGCVKGAFQFKFYQNGPADLNGKPDKDGLSTKAALYIYSFSDSQTKTSGHIVLEMVWNSVDKWKVLEASTTPN